MELLVISVSDGPSLTKSTPLRMCYSAQRRTTLHPEWRHRNATF